MVVVFRNCMLLRFFVGRDILTLLQKTKINLYHLNFVVWLYMPYYSIIRLVCVVQFLRISSVISLELMLLLRFCVSMTTFQLSCLSKLISFCYLQQIMKSTRRNKTSSGASVLVFQPTSPKINPLLCPAAYWQLCFCISLILLTHNVFPSCLLLLQQHLVEWKKIKLMNWSNWSHKKTLRLYLEN